MRTSSPATAIRPPSEGIPRYSVRELNEAIGALLERGFAPRFLVEATVSRPQRKKGHLWLTLSDGEASIAAVAWASTIERLSYLPEEGDGVLVVGKLNFWAARASLTVQVLDLRPGLTTVMRQFERVRAQLEPEGLFALERKRPLPALPRRIALLTSVPSSALADMLRTARERWPATGLLVVPIPVQGPVEGQIVAALAEIAARAEALEIDTVVLARGGGSREDLAVFDGVALARALGAMPVPVVCGLGHEDDTTIADLVADHRAATPTAAIVALLPDRQLARQEIGRSRAHLQRTLSLRLAAARQRLGQQRSQLTACHPIRLLEQQRRWLAQQRLLLQALSPQHLLARGFSLLRDGRGQLVRSLAQLQPGDPLELQLADGRVRARVQDLLPDTPTPASTATPPTSAATDP